MIKYRCINYQGDKSHLRPPIFKKSRCKKMTNRLSGTDSQKSSEK